MIGRIFLVLMLGLPMLGLAQESTASPYSYNGIGDFQFRGTHENRAMGGISVFADSIHLNLQDPSSLAQLKLTNYSVGINYNRLGLKNETQSASDESASVDYLAIAFPITNKMAVSFGIAPRTAVGYQLRSRGEFNEDQGQTETFSGEGGLNEIFLSAGYAITDKLSFGATGRYNFGSIQNSSTISIEDVEFGTVNDYASNLNGFDFTLGMNYRQPLSNDKYWTSNVVYNFEHKLQSENRQTLSRINTLGSVLIVSEQEVDLGDQVRTEVDIPYSMSLGFGYGKEKKWFVGANYFFNQNSHFEDRFFNVNDNVIFEDGLRASIGGFYIPKYDSFTSYWSRVVYRAGLRYEDTGLVVNGEQINDFGISFGVGLPISRNFSNINLGFELGRRGTTNASLIQENYVNVRLSVSLNDRWFQKRKYN